MKTDLFQACGHCWVFQICWHIECITFAASSFRIWNSSTGIPSPPPALFVWCFLRPTWLHIPGCLALGQWSHHCDYLGHEDLFCIVLVYSCHLFLIFSASVRSIPFLSFIVPIFAWNGEKERYKHLNAELQKIARIDKKAFLSDQFKEIEENNRMGKTRDFFKKIRDTKGFR